LCRTFECIVIIKTLPIALGIFIEIVDPSGIAWPTVSEEEIILAIMNEDMSVIGGLF
jgi:hypothetical protein